ncbi:MAG: 2-phospho-L-lactate/phosphoenolpyruvate guanylyltransferase [Nocardioidaceae bacterium]|nr:2-phospho-L-lactate/phosphoenolpyruvate guanylyltransferase [Nocardioidaceae bacterium]
MNGDVTAIVPVRRWDHSKSRLDVAPAERASLARAFSLDVLSVLVQSETAAQVVIVTDEPACATLDVASTVVVVSQGADRSVRGRAGAIGLGVRWAMRHRAGSPVVAISPDLPSLTVTSFDDSLDLLSRHALSYVRNADESGTTLIYAREPSLLNLTLGRRKALQHKSCHQAACPEVDPRVRRDVDTIADLRAALALGVGPETSTVCRRFPSYAAAAAREVDVDRQVLAARLLWG